MTEMFLVCARQTRGGRGGRRRSCSGYANTCDKTLQQIVMLNFWSQSGIHRKPSEEGKPLFSHPKTKLQIFKFIFFIYLFIYLFIFQLRWSTWRGKKQRIYLLHLEAEDIYLMESI
jgi:hypothetical protein